MDQRKRKQPRTINETSESSIEDLESGSWFCAYMIGYPLTYMLLNVCIISIYATYSACLQNNYSLHTKVISLCHYFTMHFRYICLTNNGKLKNLAGYLIFFAWYCHSCTFSYITCNEWRFWLMSCQKPYKMLRHSQSSRILGKFQIKALEQSKSIFWACSE